MPRHHTIWDSDTQQQIDVPFTPEEESAFDVEASQGLERKVRRQEILATKSALEIKLADNTITMVELLELLRIERGII
jgi:hypothetical protein